MAINILAEQSDPPIEGDYTLGLSIQHAIEVPKLSILTSWESTGSAPSAKQGAFLAHAGNTFQVQDSDESISGSPASGTNYIVATETSGVITLAWTQDISGYSYNPIYGGIYDGDGTQLLRDICYLSDSDYYRGIGMGEDFNLLRLSDGSLISPGTLTVSNDLTVSNNLTVGNNLTLTGNLIPRDADTIYSEIISDEGYMTLPAGIWAVSVRADCYYGYRDDGDSHMQTVTVFSDGTARFYFNGTDSSDTIYYRRVG